MPKILLASLIVLLCACQKVPAPEVNPGGSSNDGLTSPGDGEPADDPAPSTSWLSDEHIPLDATGEVFQAGIAAALAGADYMADDCAPATSGFSAWEDLPLERCKYHLNGQNAEVVMLNPGPRRLTAWIQDACEDLSSNVANCMQKTFRQVLYQSGGQFPVGGVVIEDMDGNGRGNAYAFRDGVTIRVAAFGTGTESLLTSTQVARSYTDASSATYSYARPVSVTREQMTRYAPVEGLTIPNLGSSSERKNSWHELTGKLYRESWFSNRSHIIRAWVYAQGF